MKKKKLVIFLVICLVITCLLFLMFKPKTKKAKNENVDTPNNSGGNSNITEPVNKEKRMSLVAVGDSLIHAAVYLDAHKGDGAVVDSYYTLMGGTFDFSSMFTYMPEIIDKYDLKYYNQETIIGGKDLGARHYPLFNSPDEIGDNLIDIGFNMVSLATNHTLDQGTKGLLYSVNYWKNKDVITAGIYDTKESRDKVRIYEQNGIKYAFLSYTTVTNGLVPQEPYYINIYDKDLVKSDIEAHRQAGAEVIIVAMHWGQEYTHTPVAEEYEIAEYLSSLGVNLIIGTHPHVIQPVAYVNDTLVIYSLGNFISAQHPMGQEKIIGLLVGLDIVVNDGKVTFENLDYELLYTYCEPGYHNFSVIPFSKLNDNLLYNYKAIEEQYMAIVKSEGL